VFTVARKLNLLVNGDIGCYTLGCLPPLSAVHTTGCMGASIGQAHGISKANAQCENVAVIGDSTFFHTGIPALLNTAYNGSDTVTIILDNRTTAMTGHQEHPGTGRTLQGDRTQLVDMGALVRSLGIDHVTTVDPYDLAEVEEVLREYIELGEPAVVIAQHPCALLPSSREEQAALYVDTEQCTGCGLCLELGCPAVSRDTALVSGTQRHPAVIDPLLCAGCGICAQICPSDAIVAYEEVQEAVES
jgi:indolepyruvate ferredoxin oxidoreductase alpha subunit